MRAVMFDAGNTLLHLDYPWLAAEARRLRRDFAPAPGDLGRAAARVGRTGWPTRDGAGRAIPFFQGYFGAIAAQVGLGSEQAVSFAAAAREENLTDPRGLWRLCAPGAAATLASLAAKGLLIGVVSNADGRVESQLAAAGLRDNLLVVVDSHLTGVEKPDPRIFHLALEQLGVNAQDALFVGDLFDVDILGARTAGLHALLYDPWDAFADLSRGRIRSLAQLLDVISP